MDSVATRYDMIKQGVLSALIVLCLSPTALGQTPTQAPVYPYPATHPPSNVSSGYGAPIQAGFTRRMPSVPARPAPGTPSYFTPQMPIASPPPLYAAPTQFPAPIGSGQIGPSPSFQSQPTFSGNGITSNGIPAGALPADIIINVPQGTSGRAMIGGTYGSDNDFVGEFIIDERNFDIARWPRSIGDAFGPSAWRGNGQTFRLEAVPGNRLERYLVSFSDPYIGDSLTSFSVSGYYFDREYFDWNEQRSGGRIGIGRKLTNYLSLNAGLRLEGVTMTDPRVGTSPQLNSVLGYSNLFLGSVGLVYDTRFTPFMPNEGSYLALTYKQAFGDHSFSRGEVDYRTHRILYKQTPTSGYHTLSFRTKLGFSSSSTPVFESFIAGGTTTLRGFEFRGVSPLEGGVRVGGDFQWLNSLEYKFPIGWDDHYHGVLFADFGTVEESVKLSSDSFRVAPGIGLRIDIPWAGLGAPLAFDYAIPVSTATGDLEQRFSFFVGLRR